MVWRKIRIDCLDPETEEVEAYRVSSGRDMIGSALPFRRALGRIAIGRVELVGSRGPFGNCQNVETDNRRKS